MLASSRASVSACQSFDKPVRLAPPSPQQFSPRETRRPTESAVGSSRALAAAETSALRSRLDLLQTCRGPSAETTTTAGPSRSAALATHEQLRLHLGAANCPHPDKLDYGGEDAYFVSPVGGGAFGVADGVGGWQDSGINPAEYSRTFMRLACAYLEGKTVNAVTASELAEASGGSSRGLAVTPANASLADEAPAASADGHDAMSSLTPQGALAAAHSGTRLPGSTTACVMRLNRSTNCLSAANLGDSGFLLVRDGAAVFRSPALQHFFDCPLQQGHSQQSIQPAAKANHVQFAAFPDYTSATDTAEDAGLYELPLLPGDIIVAGTDGLWDNVQQDEIVKALPKDQSLMSQAAKSLVHIASCHARDKQYPSPYSQEAVKQGIDLPWILRLTTASFSEGKFRLGHLKGGKLDDITVITAFVAQEP